MIYSYMPPDELLEKAIVEYGKDRYSFEVTIRLANLLLRHGSDGRETIDYYKWAKDLIEDDEIKRELEKRILWIGGYSEEVKAFREND